MLQVYRLEQEDDILLLRKSLDQLTKIHPMLRSKHSSLLEFSICECADYHLDEATLPAADETLCAGLLELRIDISVAPFRARMYRVDGQAAFLALSIHHIVMDGPSQQVIYGHLMSILAAGREGGIASLPLHSASKIGRIAIAHHINALTAPAELVDHVQLRLPFERVDQPLSALDFVPRVGAMSTWHISEQTISAAQQSARRMGITLNAFLFGTLAWRIFECSGQHHFAVGQTFLGRRLDELQAVGSFSTILPFVFDFAGDPSLRDTCQQVHCDTQRVMSNEFLVQREPIPTVCYELNDLRPLPWPAEERQAESSTHLADLFFLVNQYAQGFAVVASYDAGKYDADCVESLVLDWVKMWSSS